MSALRPRRIFAASFVVVTAAACTKRVPKAEDTGSNHGSSGPPRVVDAAGGGGEAADAAAVTAVTAADAAPPGDAPAKLLAIYYVSSLNGDCFAMQNNLDCPPNLACNPPPPQKIACPPGIGMNTSNSVQVGQLTDGTCAVIEKNCKVVSCAHAATPCPSGY